MNELATKYNPSEVEDKWYDYWMRHDLFKSTPDAREPYTIVIPPPNVTGVLHIATCSTTRYRTYSCAAPA